MQSSVISKHAVVSLMQHAHTGMKSLVGTRHQKQTDIYIGAAKKRKNWHSENHGDGCINSQEKKWWWLYSSLILSH